MKHSIQRTIATLALVAAASACGRSNGRAADSSLSSDLSLAAQQHTYDSLAAAERSPAPNALAGGTQSTPVHRATSGGEVTHRHTSSGTVAQSSGGTVEKHTQRDAAIGAAAGAILGATTSKNKVKGGLIGAAVGGVLGGVIGNNVDKKKKP